MMVSSAPADGMNGLLELASLLASPEKMAAQVAALQGQVARLNASKLESEAAAAAASKAVAMAVHAKNRNEAIMNEAQSDLDRDKARHAQAVDQDRKALAAAHAELDQREALIQSREAGLFARIAPLVDAKVALEAALAALK